MSFGIVIDSEKEIDDEIKNNIEELMNYAIEHNSFNIEIEIEKPAGYSEKYDEYYSEPIGEIDINLLDYITCVDFLDYVHLICKNKGE